MTTYNTDTQENLTFKGIYMMLKLEIWGIFLPLIVGYLFGVSSALAVVLFAVVMFMANGKKESAITVLKYAGMTILCLVFLFTIFASMAAF